MLCNEQTVHPSRLPLAGTVVNVSEWVSMTTPTHIKFRRKRRKRNHKYSPGSPPPLWFLTLLYWMKLTVLRVKATVTYTLLCVPMTLLYTVMYTVAVLVYMVKRVKVTVIYTLLCVTLMLLYTVMYTMALLMYTVVYIKLFLCLMVLCVRVCVFLYRVRRLRQFTRLFLRLFLPVLWTKAVEQVSAMLASDVTMVMR